MRGEKGLGFWAVCGKQSVSCADKRGFAHAGWSDEHGMQSEFGADAQPRFGRAFSFNVVPVASV